MASLWNILLPTFLKVTSHTLRSAARMICDHHSATTRFTLSYNTFPIKVNPMQYTKLISNVRSFLKTQIHKNYTQTVSSGLIYTATKSLLTSVIHIFHI